jgi:apoptosis-stimulating of p53 protein 1
LLQVENQEMKLRKLRSLRGQGQEQNQQQQPLAPTNASVSADLDSIRALFTDKEKELTMAVRKVDDLTHQLDDLRTGRVSNHYPPQMVELERLRRELAYRKQLNEQQNNMISQQRDQLSRGHEEIAKIDNRIVELQERLSRKRMMNQQLANQISAATSAKQAQLRAIQQGMMNRNKNKPVSTVEPFQRHQAAIAAAAAQAAAAVAAATENQLKFEDNDPKYGTLPYSTKFAPPPSSAAPPGSQNQVQMMKKIEALKQEKENNNGGSSDDLLPSPPPQIPIQRSQQQQQQQQQRVDHQGNYASATASSSSGKPISTVSPVAVTNGIDSPTSTSTPNLPPKPTTTTNSGSSPPPYVPAPQPPTASSGGGNNDSAITVLRGSGYSPSAANLSVSAHPAEEGTSVDDDMPSASENESEDSTRNNGLMVRPNHNVHISINRRIEMPPAFHFPEDQTPPSDLVGGREDMTDNAGASSAALYSGLYQDFENLTTEEKYQIFGGGAVPPSQEVEYDSDDTLNVVPDVVESEARSGPMPPGIIKKPPSSSGSSGDEKESRSRRISFDPLALLLDASLEGELELVKKTAREVPNPSAANDEGITALHNAICAGHIEIVRFLVEFGCDVNAQDSDGWTPLHCAASCNNLEMVRFLVEHGACIFATTLSDRETAAEKCEEEEEGYRGCYDYLCNIQDKLGVMNSGEVFAVYEYKAHHSDETDFAVGTRMIVVRRGDEYEREWWWCRIQEQSGLEGYVPRNLLGLYPRVTPMFGLEQALKPLEAVSETLAAAVEQKLSEEDDDDVTMSS